MPTNAIEVEGLGKRYRLGQQQAAYGTLRDSLSNVLRRGDAKPASTDLWALKDVDLTVREGEALGIVGSNGAGKSTLLKILARITEPSVGVSRTRGRVGVMLEVGTGFHPELTGRENVFLSGAVMGMTRRDVRRRFDEIVTFAGVEPFLDTPLKRYSSGMKLRLAFAVAAHLEPELMLVDEILAVGDVEFQRRCLSRMSRLSHEGRTVIFVSHDLGAVTRLCSRAVWTRKGQVVQDGDPTAIVAAYYAALPGRSGEAEFDVDGDIGVSHVALLNGSGQVQSTPPRDEPFALRARVVAHKPLAGCDLGMYLLGHDGTLLLNERWSDQPGMPELLGEPGQYEVTMHIPPVLRSGDYVIGLWVGTEHINYFDREVMSFSLSPLPGDRQEWLSRRRAIQPDVGWSSRQVADLVP